MHTGCFEYNVRNLVSLEIIQHDWDALYVYLEFSDFREPRTIEISN